jgi:hypothetical protein
MMRLRSVLAVAFLAFLFGACPVVAAQLNTGYVTMTTTGGAGSIILDINIDDDGSVTGCLWFIVLRDGAQIAVFQRKLGVQNTFQYVDTNVQPDRTYWYELVGSALPVPIAHPNCPEYAFRTAYGSGWGLPLNVPGHTGNDPAPVGHGRLSPDEFDPNYARLELCGYPFSNTYYFLLPQGNQAFYGQDVLMYAEYCCWNVQFGWDFDTSSISFELLPCTPLATKPVTWGHVKSLYR